MVSLIVFGLIASTPIQSTSEGYGSYSQVDMIALANECMCVCCVCASVCVLVWLYVHVHVGGRGEGGVVHAL